MSEVVIKVDSIVTRFGDKTVHNGISFDIESGQVLALIGGSGCGKSTLLKEIVGLHHPTEGKTFLFGHSIWESSEEVLKELRNRFGLLFQNGALFSSLTAGENIAVPIVETNAAPKEYINDIVQLKLSLVGLSPDTAKKMPSELSGGMRKRVALARALVLEPEILFLDEPTSGLDPISAREFDKLIRTLTDSLGLTTFMVTHDLDTILSIVDRVIVLEKGSVLADGKPAEVSRQEHPWIKEYFSARVH